MDDLSHIYEKLGQFYLGQDYDLEQGQLGANLTLYDSKDLCTHAVCVGMTGSGKTGLGVTLLEEAAIDGIPALVVDPKGDMTNLLLSFPELSATQLEPWINAEDANRAGISVAEFANQQAEMWRKGIGQWHQSQDRIRRLRDACDFNIYTPGSDAGIPISILSSFQVPPAEVLADNDLLRDRIATTATSLLALLGIDADPIRSREHILLTTILDDSWKKKVSLDLGALIQMVQNPPVQKIGVMDIESFFPAKDRFELAMALNNLLAAPGFAAWMEGVPLDIQSLLYGPDGKPRVSVLYIAHLSEAERMFFMSLLLNQTLGWMRTRSGTSSLRALLYIDEIFGYMPPVSEPPSKKPLLTLLKQARAYGLGLVLATQNPVDLDYKGLSNAGTWFLGRLQTDRDKQRVLDGLEGASAEAGGSFDRNQLSDILSGVGKRVFLMHNVHDSAPVTFHTRWALSYLSGPMTRSQIKRLMADKKAKVAEHQPDVSMPHQVAAAPAPERDVADDSAPPVLPPEVSQVFLPIRRAAGSDPIHYEPRLLAIGKVHFVDTRRDLAADEDLVLLASLGSAFGVDWEEAVSIPLDADELLRTPPLNGTFAEVPSEASQAKSYKGWEKQLKDHVYRTRRYRLFRCKQLKAYSQPGDTESDFRIRLTESAREERDERIEKLRDKFANRIASAEERIRKAELRLQREEEQASGARMQSVISAGAAVLSMVLGRKRLSSRNVGRVATAARGHGRAQTQQDDVRRAAEDVDAYEEKLDDLLAKIEAEVDEIEDRFDVQALELDELLLKPRKTDIQVQHVALAWVPFTTDAAGRPVSLIAN